MGGGDGGAAHLGGLGFTFARVGGLGVRLPAPRFFSGILAVLAHNRRGHPSFLMGQRSPNGFWYYFPAVLAVKTPLALFGLVGMWWCTGGWYPARRLVTGALLAG